MNEDLPTRLSHLKHLVKAKKNKPEFKPEEIKPELESEEIKPEFKPEPKKWLLTCGTYFNLSEGIKKCPVCNSQVTPLVGKGRPRKYCSRKCALDDHARKHNQRVKDSYTYRTIYCSSCFKEITTSDRTRVTCGNDLCVKIHEKKKQTERVNKRFGERKWEIVECKNCEKLFEVRRRRVRRKEKIFCSRKCSSQFKMRYAFENLTDYYVASSIRQEFKNLGYRMPSNLISKDLIAMKRAEMQAQRIISGKKK